MRSTSVRGSLKSRQAACVIMIKEIVFSPAFTVVYQLFELLYTNLDQDVRLPIHRIPKRIVGAGSTAVQPGSTASKHQVLNKSIYKKVESTAYTVRNRPVPTSRPANQALINDQSSAPSKLFRSLRRPRYCQSLRHVHLIFPDP